ncbi:TolC family protein [Chitinophaga sp. sic0106]|uniref:TolC family protein n=1 Tax=Chitinophaga sp. sic0106 TaxID=2854785 RepID=UPI001C48C7F0|nr:TolC family protein [Chitinophaga sp. sic0106]MBV7532007.1 TolC family protein [Chitinophaga sp. sic0106]
MKKLLLIALSLCMVLLAAAQSNDSLDINTILKNPGMEHRFKQVLINLASKTPTQDAVDTKEKISDYQISNAKLQWLNHLSFFTNLNENSFNRNTVYYNPNDPKTNVNQNNYYPTYNVGLAFALGDLFTTPKMVKIAVAQKKLLAAERQDDLRGSRNKVLNDYENFVAAKKILELHMPILEDAYNNHQALEKKFTAGEISLEVYSTGYKAYNQEMVQQINLNKSYNLTKIELETTINMPLESAISLLNK